MLMRAGEAKSKNGSIKLDRFAHIPKEQSDYSLCGKTLDNAKSVKGCELCGDCLGKASSKENE